MDLSWILGHARTSYFHSEQPISLTGNSDSKTNSSPETDRKSHLSFPEFCKSALPSCWLNPFLFNGHLQTAYTLSKSQDVPVIYKRKIFTADDPAYEGTFAVDFVVHSPSSEPDATLPERTTYFTDEEFSVVGSNDSKPMLICLHGLSGGSYELYLRHVMAPLTAPESGWEGLVVNARGCAGSKITSSVLFNARATWDVRQVIKWCRDKWPNRPLFGVGFSLGANILTNYVGEEGSTCALSGAVVISNPWNLETGSLALQRTWIGLNVYLKIMGQNMKRLFNTHIEQISKNPKIDLKKVEAVTYLHEFDRYVQGPTWGYPTEGAYYRDASSADAVLAVRIPFLGINAEDDPIAVKEALPVEEFKTNPYTVLCTTTLGGHLGSFEIGGTRWFARAAVAFLQKLARDVDFGAMSRRMADGAIINGELVEQPGEPVYDPNRRKLHVPQ